MQITLGPQYNVGEVLGLDGVYFAWPRVSSGSDGLYLSLLSDMSPATSDCLEPYFSVFLFFSFPIIACVLTFLGPFTFF